MDDDVWDPHRSGRFPLLSEEALFQFVLFFAATLLRIDQEKRTAGDSVRASVGFPFNGFLIRWQSKNSKSTARDLPSVGYARA